MNPQGLRPTDDTLPEVGVAACVVAGGVALLNWLGAQLSWAVFTGHWLRRPLGSSFGALLALRRHLGDPATVWLAPGERAAVHPGALGYYAALAALTLVAASIAFLPLRALRHRRSNVTHGSRKGGQPGARWARRRDLRTLSPRRRSRHRRLVLGAVHTIGRAHLVATEARHSVIVFGPTQSGKTSGLAIPALLEWDGPALATSVKDDLARHTKGWRARRGPVWLFDPSASSGLDPLSRWSPLALCADWAGAQRTAASLVNATPARAGMADAAFWYAAAAKQLAPLLLAANLAGWTMAEVVRWTNTGDLNEPLQTLLVYGQDDAATALSACAGRDERIRSSVDTTLETVLAPFEHPAVAAWTSRSDFDLDDLFGTSATLYLCGPSHEQNRVQGVFAALVSSVLAAAVERSNRTGGPLDPPLLVVLDEAANIAPVHDLDTVASTCAGLGIQLVTVCQDLGQLSSRYGSDRSRTIVNNHRAKVLLSGVSDLPTLDLISGLAGEEAVREDSYTFDQTEGRRSRSSATAFRRLLPTDRLRRVPPGEGVLIYGHLPPAHIRLRPWFADPTLRRRAGAR